MSPAKRPGSQRHRWPTKDALRSLLRERSLTEQGCSTCLPPRCCSLRNTGIEERKWMNRQITEESQVWTGDKQFFFMRSHLSSCYIVFAKPAWLWVNTVSSQLCAEGRKKITRPHCDCSDEHVNAHKVPFSHLNLLLMVFLFMRGRFLCLHSSVAHSQSKNIFW